MAAADGPRRSRLRATSAILPILIAAVLFGLGAAVAVHTEQERQRDLEQARTAFREEGRARTAQVSASVEQTFRSMYEGLRTIARLPGVRTLGGVGADVDFRGGGERFDANTRSTIQEIYNNLASHVDMSEVYLVPLALDPEPADPSSTAPREPWITFDQLILGRSRMDGENGEEHEPVPEIELYEYREMAAQLAWFRANVPTEEHIRGLAYPALSSREVVTCDNRRYDARRPDDLDRSGLVYSVPFFDAQGALAGCVSGIVLTHALRDLLPSPEYVLLDLQRGYAAVPNAPGVWQQHAPAWKAGRAAEDLIYSDCARLVLQDELGGWRLWSACEDADYTARSDVDYANLSARTAHVLTSFVLAATLLATWFVRRRQSALDARNAELEARVRERTAELLEATRKAGMAEVAGRMLHNVGNALNSATVSVRLLRESLGTSKAGVLARASAVLSEHEHDLPGYFQRDARARQLPKLLSGLAAEWSAENGRMTAEVDDLLRSTAHMAEILERQRDLAASAPCLLEALPLDEIAESALRVVKGAAQQHGIELARDFQRADVVSIDRSRASQILVNLLTNAIDACREARDGRAHRIVVRTRADDGALLVEVQDDGPGIAAENLTRIFHGRFTTKTNGHGIGLHASAVAAGEFGAKLEVASDGLGRGARFTLRIPARIPDGALPGSSPRVGTAAPSVRVAS